MGSGEFAKANKQRQRYEESAMNLLKNYTCHSSLDTVRVLKAFPDNWVMSKGRSYNMMKFLKTILDHKLTLQENNAIGEGLSKMESINMDCKVAMRKKAFVKITSDYI